MSHAQDQVVADEDCLLDQAAKCRNLARNLKDPAVVAELIRFAEALEAQAQKERQPKQ